MSYLGYSNCRFHCGIADAQMGTRDFTDGTRVWPEGLVHYVETHDIRLPSEFVEQAVACKGTLPREVRLPTLDKKADGSTDIPVSFEFWFQWSGQSKP